MSAQIIGSDFIVNICVAYDRLPCHEGATEYFGYKQREAYLQKIPGAFLFISSTIRPGAENRLSMEINTKKPGIKDKYGNSTICVDKHVITCVACTVRCLTHEDAFNQLTENHEVTIRDEHSSTISVFMGQCFFFCSGKCKEAFELAPVLYV